MIIQSNTTAMIHSTIIDYTLTYTFGGISYKTKNYASQAIHSIITQIKVLKFLSHIMLTNLVVFLNFRHYTGIDINESDEMKLLLVLVVMRGKQPYYVVSILSFCDKI